MLEEGEEGGKEERAYPADPTSSLGLWSKNVRPPLLWRSVPKSMNIIFFHKRAFLWTPTCRGHFCFYWQPYSRGMKVHHGADVYFSTTGGTGREPMERELWKRGRQMFRLGRSRTSLGKNECVRCLPATAKDRTWPWSQCYLFPAATAMCVDHIFFTWPASTLLTVLRSQSSTSFIYDLARHSTFPSLSNWVALDKFLHLSGLSCLQNE